MSRAEPSYMERLATLTQEMPEIDTDEWHRWYNSLVITEKMAIDIYFMWMADDADLSKELDNVPS